MAIETRTSQNTENERIVLSAARKSGGMLLFTALAQRHSVRAFGPQAVPKNVLSDLLWAAFGINRPSSGDRTAPYWRHVMVIDLCSARWRRRRQDRGKLHEGRTFSNAAQERGSAKGGEENHG